MRHASRYFLASSAIGCFTHQERLPRLQLVSMDEREISRWKGRKRHIHSTRQRSNMQGGNHDLAYWEEGKGKSVEGPKKGDFATILLAS
jgi:hypothetical protein